MNWDMLIKDIQSLLGGRKLDGQDTLAVVDGFSRPFAQLRTLAIGSAVLVQQRVIAVVGKAKAIVLSAVPTIMEAVAIPVYPLNRIDAAFGNGALLAHLLLGLICGREGFEDAHAQLGSVILCKLAVAAIGSTVACTRVARRRVRGIVGQRQGDGGV